MTPASGPGGPRPLTTIDRVSGVVLALCGALVLWECRGLPLGTLGRPGPAFVPAVLASLLVVLALLVVAFGGRSRALPAVDWRGMRHAASILAAGAFAAVALEPLGYRTTMTVTLAFLLGAPRRRRLAGAVAGALAFAVASHWLFRRLGVLLPPGPFGF